MLLKILSLHYIQVLSQYGLCRAAHVYLTYLMLQRQLSHLNGSKLGHRQDKASYNFFISDLWSVSLYSLREESQTTPLPLLFRVYSLPRECVY
jgi:hypothetical protein